jgi:hypothetical protein
MPSDSKCEITCGYPDLVGLLDVHATAVVVLCSSVPMVAIFHVNHFYYVLICKKT